MSHKIEHDSKYQQFTLAIGNDEAELAYATPSDKVLDFTHTYVPEQARGNGISSLLITEGLKFAAKNGYQVIASCPAVANFIKEHPEYKHLLFKE
jgi:uncharacterized protein